MSSHKDTPVATNAVATMDVVVAPLAGLIALTLMVTGSGHFNAADFTWYMLYCGLPYAVFLSVAGSFSLIQESKATGWRLGWFVIGGTAFGTIVAGGTVFLCYSVAIGAYVAYQWGTAPNIVGFTAVTMTAVGTLLVGGILFYFRLRCRSIYGLTETCVGLTVAGIRASTAVGQHQLDGSFYLAVLTAGVYLVVRGLDNIHHGLTKAPTDEVALFLIAKARQYYEEISKPVSDSGAAATVNTHPKR